MNKRVRSIHGPAALVGALAAGRRGKRHRRRSSLLEAGAGALRAARTAAEQLSERSTLSPKRRRALLRTARKRADRFSSVANGVGALLGVAAAGAEVVSAIRDHKDHGHSEQRNRAATRGTATEWRTEREDDVTDLGDEDATLGDEGDEGTEREEDEKQEVFEDARR